MMGEGKCLRFRVSCSLLESCDLLGIRFKMFFDRALILTLAKVIVFGVL